MAGLRSLVAGGVGGVCAVISGEFSASWRRRRWCLAGWGLTLHVGHPFDLVKVRMQTAETGVYKGAFDVVKRTVAKEGVFRVCPESVVS